MEHPYICLPLTKIQITTDTAAVPSAVKRGSIGWIAHAKITNSGLRYRVYFYRFGVGGRARVTSTDIGPFSITTRERLPVISYPDLIDVTTLTKEPLLSWLAAMKYFLRQVSREYISRDFNLAFTRPGTFMHDLENVEALYENNSVKLLEKVANQDILQQTLQQLRHFQTCIAPALDLFYSRTTTQVEQIFRKNLADVQKNLEQLKK